MAIVTTYRCDRCGKECPGGDQFWSVELRVAHFGGASSHLPDRKVWWCRACVDEFRLIGAIRALPEPAPKAPTLEDAIREIVRETVREEVGDA